MRRTLRLKAVRFRSGRRTDFRPPDLDQLVRQIFDATATARERHHPYPPDPSHADDSRWNCFAQDLVTLGGSNAAVFEYCSYVPGHVPTGMRLDLDQPSVPIRPLSVEDDATGERMEIAHTAQVLALGEVMLVESVRGNGGLIQLARYLTEMARRHIDRSHPSLELYDVSGPELREMIERAGGVDSVSLRMAQAPAAKGCFARLLSPVQERIRGSEVLVVSWKAKRGEISADDAIAAFDEASASDELDSVRVVLHDGSVIAPGQSRLKKTVDVGEDEPGVPSKEDLRRELVGYLAELQEIRDGSRIIDQQGRLVARVVL